MKVTCNFCGGPIRMMVVRGTGYCSALCAEEDKKPIQNVLSDKFVLKTFDPPTSLCRTIFYVQKGSKSQGQMCGLPAHHSGAHK